MIDDQQPSEIQREALRILAAVMKSGAGFTLAAIEAELAGLDDPTAQAVRGELQRLFDSMIGMACGEVREPIAGVTISGLDGTADR